MSLPEKGLTPVAGFLAAPTHRSTSDPATPKAWATSLQARRLEMGVAWRLIQRDHRHETRVGVVQNSLPHRGAGVASPSGLIL
jgi:hypothetical protein